MGKVYTVFDGNNFATKKYVDESIAAIPEVVIPELVTYKFLVPKLAANASTTLIQSVNFSGKYVIGVVPFSGITKYAVSICLVESNEGYWQLRVYVTNTTSDPVPGGEYGVGVKIALVSKIK